ncbi:MAG: hypothetical protein WDO17_11250 [Alphaproteobacteria bacterium]
MLTTNPGRKAWSGADDDQLRTLLQENIEVGAIADKMQRDFEDVLERIARLAGLTDPFVE